MKKILVCAIVALTLLATPILGCGNGKPLALTLTAPVDGATVTESEVTVRGTVSSAKATVTVNDIGGFVSKTGSFSRKVPLTEGENTINIVATKGKETVTRILTIVYSPALAIEITAPEDGAELTESPVAVTGSVSIRDASVTVDGIEVDVAEDGTFTTSIELAEGENTITVMATAEGKEPAEKTITVTYTPEHEPEEAETSPE